VRASPPARSDRPLSRAPDGLYGALVIHAPAAGPAPPPSRIDLARRQAAAAPAPAELVLLAGDWYHRSGAETLAWFRSARSRGFEPVPDNVLLNGQQTFACARSLRTVICDPAHGARPLYHVDPARRLRLRLVNPGALATVFVSVDEHWMALEEVDGHRVAPVRVRELPLAAGQRAVVVLEPVHPPRAGDAYWIRTRVSQECVPGLGVCVAC
jgi:FtsP/CotA-like multicopper oxidase with cupredoxin domain